MSDIDSAGIGVLVGRYLSVRRRGGDMKLANLTARSHRVMTITQLLDVFDCFDSIDEAVEGFAIANLIGFARISGSRAYGSRDGEFMEKMPFQSE